MLFGVDIYAASFLLIYGMLVIVCFSYAAKKFKRYINKKKKPKLTLIQGGKREKRGGPYG